MLKLGKFIVATTLKRWEVKCDVFGLRKKISRNYFVTHYYRSRHRRTKTHFSPT